MKLFGTESIPAATTLRCYLLGLHAPKLKLDGAVDTCELAISIRASQPKRTGPRGTAVDRCNRLHRMISLSARRCLASLTLNVSNPSVLLVRV